MCQTIAELSWNHGGDMQLAEKMIIAAAKSEATFAKFQTWSVSRLKDGPWDQDGRRQIYEKAELSDDQHLLLNKICQDNGIRFLTSVFSAIDAERAAFCDAIKIPSTEITNIPLLEKVNSLYKTVYLSTGAATFEEIAVAVQTLNKPFIFLLHCVSSYPCEFKNAYLPRIVTLNRKFGHTLPGYSGHCFGIQDAIASLEYGVEVIEKHFTIDQNLPGRDNKFAILPHEMQFLNDYIKNRREMHKVHFNPYLECEEDVRNNYRGRWDNKLCGS